MLDDILNDCPFEYGFFLEYGSYKVVKSIDCEEEVEMSLIQ